MAERVRRVVERREIAERKWVSNRKVRKGVREGWWEKWKPGRQVWTRGPEGPLHRESGGFCREGRPACGGQAKKHK